MTRRPEKRLVRTLQNEYQGEWAVCCWCGSPSPIVPLDTWARAVDRRIWPEIADAVHIAIVDYGRRTRAAVCPICQRIDLLNGDDDD